MWKTRVILHGCCFFVQQFFLLDSQSNPIENVIVQGLKLIRDESLSCFGFLVPGLGLFSEGVCCWPGCPLAALGGEGPPW